MWPAHGLSIYMAKHSTHQAGLEGENLSEVRTEAGLSAYKSVKIVSS